MLNSELHMETRNQRGIIAFEDGEFFEGTAFGASATVVGEAVFNTGLTGYQETLTDPSYYSQILTLTAPHVGNYGTNDEDVESSKIQVQGLIVNELSPTVSSWRSNQSLEAYLEANGIPGISGIDTRALTKKLRHHGTMKACLTTEPIQPEVAVQKAQAWSGLAGIDCTQAVTCKVPYVFEESKYGLFTVPGTHLYETPQFDRRFHVVAFDLGAKLSIFRKLSYHGFKVTVVPSTISAEAVKALAPECIFLSNGPGDPTAAVQAHKTVAALLPHYPTFGICMGHQIITHALGATTFKLKFGHRGANQPVKNLESDKVFITSQNHGYASDAKALESKGCIVTEINLNDGTVEGMRHKDLPFFSVQYHPEACPGPNDTTFLFGAFYQMVHNCLA
jgi:carbamoyl-phosphate synthase small subunit